ncbi:MAG TPA: glycosyltransferase family 39 protein [Thermoanaerobaculia bacterium]|nr:glycosyltransferase family 39 protein [Thermoanaerobaculia bacterium]
MMWLIILSVAAAVVRWPMLSRPMGTDESASFIYYASHPLWVPMTIYGSPNNHILHSVLMHIAWKTFGGAEWALRLPAFLAGIAIIPLTYIAARELSERGALVAAALAAAAPVLADYSTDARGYTLLCCCVLICIASMARIIRTGSNKASLLFAISAALGFFTVPVMLYPFVMLAMWGRRKGLVAVIGAIVLTILLYAPVLVVSGIESLTANPYVRPLPIAIFFRSVPSYAAAVWSSMFAGVPLVIQILVAIGFVIGVRRQPIWLGFMAVMALIALQRVLPFPRIWLPFLLLMFITAAAAWPWSRTEPAIAAAVFVALTVAGISSSRLRETGELRAVREITRELNRRASPGDPVLALPPSDIPLALYCHRVEVLHPDVNRARLFAIENRDYGQTLPRTLAFFRIDPRRFAIRRVRDFGSSALYELDAL